MNHWADKERDETLEAINARLERMERALLAIAQYLEAEDQDEPTFDLDGNANRPNRDPNETL